MVGVLGCFLVEAWALLYPSTFSFCYVLCILPLLAMRVYLYASAGWYFLIDFCYFANVLRLPGCSLPGSIDAFRANFLLVSGPLAMAVPIWRNSLVFHSLDRVTSSYIHVLPPIFAFAPVPASELAPPSGRLRCPLLSLARGARLLL